MSRSQVLKVQDKIREMLRVKNGMEDLLGGYRKRKPGRPKGSKNKRYRKVRGSGLTATAAPFGAGPRIGGYGRIAGAGIREMNKMVNEDLNYQASQNGIPKGRERTVYKIHAVQQMASNGQISQQQAHDLLTKYQVGSQNIQYAQQALGMGRRRYY